MRWSGRLRKNSKPEEFTKPTTPWKSGPLRAAYNASINGGFSPCGRCFSITQLPNYPITQCLSISSSAAPRASPSRRWKSWLAAGHRIHLVVTQPDRPKGRGLELVASPVKQSALKLNLPITQPDRIKTNDEFRAQLTALKPDAIIVVGYGRIIPQWMLDLPPLGNINLHASLLPKYRGAAPIQWAIANGETVTGVTTMRIDAGLDTGDILLQHELPIAPDDTAETIAPPLAAMGADLVVETLRKLQAVQSNRASKTTRKSTLAPILKKEDGLIDFSRTAQDLQPHSRLPTLARRLHKIPRQESADPESPPCGRSTSSRRTRR